MIWKLLAVGAVAALLAAAPASRPAHGDDLAHIESATLTKLQAIAKDYAKLGRVDDEARFAPALCRPAIRSPARLSTSDMGWVYATAKPDGTLTSAGGAGMSCARCHRLAKNDHLFGLDGKKPAGRGETK